MSTPLDPEDLRDFIANEDDFGHEMRVGGVIRSFQAVTLEHGGTYTDPVTNKPRQFDYRCLIEQGRQRLSLAVECKNLSPRVPLFLCGTKRQEKEAFHELIEACNYQDRKGAIIVGPSSLTRRLECLKSFYCPGEFVGKSLLRIETDKQPMVRKPDSDIYEKWAQALSSAVDLARSASPHSKDFSSPESITAVLPVVVVPEDVLWKVAYDSNGNITRLPEKTTECELYLSYEIKVGFPAQPQWFTFSHVHFFTLGGFGSFLSKMTVNGLAWARLFNIKAITDLAKE